MPGLVRKLVIFAAVDGLILQAHGPTEHHKALRIDYKTRKITPYTGGVADTAKSSPQLESHGIIGLLSIASFSFLISITRRELVAQIFGKPIYVVTDVTILPLSSQLEATKAIKSAITSQSTHRSADSDLEDSSDSDIEDHRETEAPVDPPDASVPPDPEESPSKLPASGTRIIEDVIAKKGQYSKFASQWFSKKGWSLQKPPNISVGIAPTEAGEQELKPLAPPSLDAKSELEAAEGESRDDKPNPATAQHESPLEISKAGTSSESTTALLPKIVRSAKLILSSRSYYFSYDINLTRRLAISGLDGLKSTTKESYDPLYFWNRWLGSPFFQAGQDSYLMPIMQGFVGQRSFIVKRNEKGGSHSVATIPVDLEASEVTEGDEPHPSQPVQASETSQEFLLTLISRRSARRSGLRYLRRGIDDEGNCANSVETEQILSSPSWAPSSKICSFVQIRGSIPLYFSQTPYSFKPVPTLYQSSSTNQAAMKLHFEDLQKRYGGIQIALLVDKHGGEFAIGQAYEKAVTELNETGRITPLAFEWFDFHAECRGMKFENVERLVNTLDSVATSFGETVIEDGVTKQTQKGIIRSNCMDCLDRTNVVESAFGQYMLQRDLQEEGFDIDLLHDESTTWINQIWADNGDAISRQYASTAALKGDFTRTRKRNYRGALNDLGLTLSRYYNNIFNDYFAQAVIDVLLGNVSSTVFDDFESALMSADPGISIAKVRETAIETCSKIVIQDAEEDLIHGWTLLSPAHPNTLRTLPFEESVVLLTNAALYCCKFDWNTEKVDSFEKVDLLSVTNIHFGTYITSTLTERQMDENLNVGLVVLYKPGKSSVMRVNTRSLQNMVPSENLSHVDGGTGIMSWLGPRTSTSLQTMALKIIPSTDMETQSGKTSETPLAIAENISDEIRRAATAGTEKSDKEQLDMVKKSDIISLAEAKKRTGYLEQLGHSIKKLVWT